MHCRLDRHDPIHCRVDRHDPIHCRIVSCTQAAMGKRQQQQLERYKSAVEDIPNLKSHQTLDHDGITVTTATLIHFLKYTRMNTKHVRVLALFVWGTNR